MNAVDAPVFIGIDFGTSGARIAAVNEAKTLLWQTSITNSAIGARSNATEWKTQLFELIAAIPTPLKPRLGAIAINGTSSTVLLLDQAGQVLDSPLRYDDDRGKVMGLQLQTLAPPQHLVQSATSSLAKLLWWTQQPVFAEAYYFCHQADWLAALLHGQWGISDYHNTLKLGYDPQALSYPAWLTQASWFPLLPRVVAPGMAIAPLKQELATQWNLPKDCWICAGTTDSIAAFIASGASVPGDAVTSLGSTLVLKLLSTHPVSDLDSGVYSHRFGDLWLAGGASNAGGAVLQQFFSPADLNRISQAIDPLVPCELDYYPLLQPGERFPINDPDYPPRLSPRPEDDTLFLHGLLQGLTRIEKWGYERLEQLGASSLKHVFTAGGGSHNPVWQALRKRALGVPVSIPSHTEAAYGSACLAADGYRNLKQ